MHIEKLGPYRIEEKIGKGGMGAVYRAVYEAPGEHAGMQVAIKALSAQLAMTEGFRERFEAEIESLKKLRHEGIVRLYGYGEQDGILFYSMELVEGTSLDEEISSGRRFDWHETIQFGIQICRALKHAHDHGIVHRDIKPANLLLTADNQIKIADFGIARLFGGTQLTMAGGVLGTADYMSPEQADGRPVTEKCDQYSLGGVMYALLTGRPPFRAKSMPEMLQLQRFAEPEPVRRYAPETPAQLDLLIGQLLAKDPAERFPNVLVLGRHMEAMNKALSRISQTKQAEDSEKLSASPATNQTTVFGQEGTSSTEATAQPPLSSETDQAALELYDAPTVAEPSQPERTAQTSTAESVSTGEQEPKGSRFTTIDEDPRRQDEQTPDSSLALYVQLVGLVTILGFMIWGGWRLMQPPTADELYGTITTGVDEQGLENLRTVSTEVKDFIERFPADPRIEEIEQYQQQLEFQRFIRQAQRKSRLGNIGEMNAVESKYFAAMALAETDPAHALKMLRSLLALYDPTDETADDLTLPTSDNDEDINRRWLVLVRQQMERLKTQVEQQAASQLPILDQRLSAAAELEKAQPALAKQMYQAIIDLYGGQTWAEEVVQKARDALSSEKAVKP